MQNILVEAIRAMPQCEAGVPAVPLSCGIAKGQKVTLLSERDIRPYLQMLAGLESPSAGQLVFPGWNDIGDRKQLPEAWCRKITFLDNRVNLLSTLSGMDNLQLPASYHKIANEQEIARRAENLLSLLAQAFDFAQLPAYFTRLQQRQLLILRSAMLDPQVLVVDDPYVGLALEEQQAIRQLLSDIVEVTGMAIVLSSSDSSLVMGYPGVIVCFAKEETVWFDDWQKMLQSDHSDLACYRKTAKYDKHQYPPAADL